jgi:hypothetical protein
LTRERLYLGAGNYDEGVRIVFQAFSDFLLLKRRLELSDDPVNDPAVKSWLAEKSSWGINEAATILFPEVHGVELPDLLGIKLGREPDLGKDPAVLERHRRARHLYQSLVETLPYRESKAISQRTIDLLNAAQPYMSRADFYRVLFILAPQPGNRLNGEGLHRYLQQRRMPQRDGDFGFATYHELSDPFSPASRLARWAADGPYPEYTPHVVELACIPLCWLMSSPNRFMRDWVTKALVQLLRGHLDVMRALVERFWNVDDPYVAQRVIVIAYGALLRSTPVQADQAKALAELVHSLVFTKPIRPDELLLDAARGVVRWATAHHLLPASALDTSLRPYGFTPPGPPPTTATIETKYPRRDLPEDESYASIHFSLMSLGDFGHYVVESGLHRFSRYRIGQPMPEREPREPRFIKRRWRKFVESLSEEQKAALADRLDDPNKLRIGRLTFMTGGEDDPLTEAQRELLDKVFVYRKRVDHRYPADVAKRWIFRRTISLGWTPKLFGKEDRSIGHGRGREGHKAERWGKKYQWMAYHELLARVADNYQASNWYHDSQAYEGLHEFTGRREIDPSLPPIDFRAFNERRGTDTTAWGPSLVRMQEWPPARLGFGRYQRDVKRFMADTESEPTVARSVFVKDRDGEDWVVLESYIDQVDPVAGKGYLGLQETSHVDTLLIAARQARAFVEALAGESRHEIHDLVDDHGHTDCCYVGEVGRVSPKCPHRHETFHAVTAGGRSFQVVPTVELYAWEGSVLDCSISETARIGLPSTFLQQAAHLAFDVRGPSWLNAAGNPVFNYYEEPDNESRALLVRASFLRESLTEHNLALIVLHWFRRIEIVSDWDINCEHPMIESSIEAWLTPSLTVHLGSPRRTEHDLT